jgi:hypothetical protein
MTSLAATSHVASPLQADPMLVYSGTAAAELRQLHAPALVLIAHINQLMRPETDIGVLAHAHGWHEVDAALWLSPLGSDVIIEPSPADQTQGPFEWLMHAFGTATQEAPTTTQLVDLSSLAVVDDIEDERISPAFDAFKDLVRWLRATDDEVASMIGVGRTTPYAWKREGREPRRSTVRKLFQTHAVLAGLVNKLGEEPAVEWLVLDDPSRRERVLAGDLAAVQNEARPLLFGRRQRRIRPGSWMPDEGTDE